MKKNVRKKNPLAIYIHIPFCEHKCIYCDFYSIIKFENLNSFLDSLEKEIVNSSKITEFDLITSIFFGGGTPSILTPTQISRIVNLFYKNYHVAENVEITIETNPGTVDKKKLSELKALGINRISIGVQSFNNEDLKFLTRIHNREEAIEIIESASEVGFNNINIDLIFSLPNQTVEIWEANLQQAISLPINHISAYSLILEKGTVLNKMVLERKVELNSSESDATIYMNTIKTLADNGFNQYEVSNFCQAGFECKHNLAYWEHQKYIGFGPSAHSFDGKNRWWNYSGVKQYINKIEEKGSAVCNSEELSSEDLLDEFVMLSMRSRGLDLERLNKIHGNEWISTNSGLIDELVANNYLIKKNNFIKFTAKGYLLCDEILLKLK